MKSSNQNMYFRECGRCGGALECFSTHSYCAGCNYSDVLDEPYKVSAEMECFLIEKELLREAKKITRPKKRDDDESTPLLEAV